MSFPTRSVNLIQEEIVYAELAAAEISGFVNAFSSPALKDAPLKIIPPSAAVLETPCASIKSYPFPVESNLVTDPLPSLDSSSFQ